MQFLPYRKQTAAWRPRHFLAIKIGEFSQENSWVKIAWMQFLPAFQGSAIAPFASANGSAALPIGAKLNLLPKKQKNPSTTQYSLAKETRSLSLSKGTFSKKHSSVNKKEKNSMDFFRDCRIAAQFCTLLPRPPWLDTVCQERKNPSLPQYSLAKETRSLHSQRSVKRPVEGNLPKKNHLFLNKKQKASP